MAAPGHLDTIDSGTLLFGTVSDELMLSWLAEGEAAVPPLCGDTVPVCGDIAPLCGDTVPVCGDIAPLCGDTEALAGLELGLVV
jgi:hypothetical protein